MPNSSGKERLAPLAPVLSHPWIAEPSEQRPIVKYRVRGRCHL
jgi:hypothetical protein